MDALTEIMNLPTTGFDNNGDETVNREAAAEIVQRLEAQLAAAQTEAERLAEELNLTNGEIKGWRMRYSQVG